MRISFEKLQELQSQPEAFDKLIVFISEEGCLTTYKEQYLDVSKMWIDLHSLIRKLPISKSIWLDLNTRRSKDIGTVIENVVYGFGAVRFLTPEEVEEIANALKFYSPKRFMRDYRQNHPGLEEKNYNFYLSLYLEWKQFLQQAAKEGQAVIYWIT